MRKYSTGMSRTGAHLKLHLKELPVRNLRLDVGDLAMLRDFLKITVVNFDTAGREDVVIEVDTADREEEVVDGAVVLGADGTIEEVDTADLGEISRKAGRAEDTETEVVATGVTFSEESTGSND